MKSSPAENAEGAELDFKLGHCPRPPINRERLARVRGMGQRPISKNHLCVLCVLCGYQPLRSLRPLREIKNPHLQKSIFVVFVLFVATNLCALCASASLR